MQLLLQRLLIFFGSAHDLFFLLSEVVVEVLCGTGGRLNGDYGRLDGEGRVAEHVIRPVVVLRLHLHHARLCRVRGWHRRPPIIFGFRTSCT